MALSRCVENAVNKAVNKLGFSSVKPQQTMASNEFINGRDISMVLPTGSYIRKQYVLKNCYKCS